MLALCEKPPTDGAVVSFDQMGPVSLARQPGRAGRARDAPSASAPTTTAAPARATSSAPSTCTRTGCACACGLRRRGSDNLAFMTQIRMSYPVRTRIYWIQDNLSANWTPDIRAYAAANRIELVPTPTYASYLNPVECHFSAISQFVVCNADYLDWDAFAFALARHVTYRNAGHRDRRLATVEARQRIAA